jgi:hypothetical protein
MVDIKERYIEWVKTLPVNHQQNLLDSLERDESVTFNAFKEGYAIGCCEDDCPL